MRAVSITILILVITACSPQPPFKITVVNRSSFYIDSVIIPDQNIKWMQKISKGKTKIFEADESKMFRYNKGGYESIDIYYNQQKIEASWGHLGSPAYNRKKEFIYVFDNGINYIDTLLKEPSFFRLLIVNESSEKLDTVEIPNCQIVSAKVKNGYTELIVDYKEFRDHPILRVKQNGKIFTTTFIHNWNNWNDVEGYIYLQDGGVMLNSLKKLEQRLQKPK